MVLLKKCCFCVPLKAGCLILGTINLIGTSIALILSVYAILFGIECIKSVKPREVDVGYMIIGISTVLAIILVIALAFCIVLLVGINTNKPGHVKAYLIYNFIFLVIYTILLLIRIIYRMSGIIDGVLNIAVSIYFLLVIKSYYEKMKEEKDARETQKV